MLRVTKRCAAFFFGVAAILLFLAGGAAYANSACELNLPGPITMTVDVNEYKACNTLFNFRSLLNAMLTNVPPGSSVPAGTYDGFCADLIGGILDNPLFGPVVYQIQLYSSLDPTTIPDSLKRVTSTSTNITYQIPWNKINYVINKYPIPLNSWLDVQAAIWSLVHGCTAQTNPLLWDCPPEREVPYYFPFGTENPNGPFGCPPNGIVNKNNVLSIVADANDNGADFIPGSGDLFALIIDITQCSGAISDYCSYAKQVVFIPYGCPCIDLKKEVSPDGVNWYDANASDCSDAPVTTDLAEYRLTIKNCGGEALTNLVINDSVLGIVDYSVGQNLPVGSSIVLTSSQQIPGLSNPNLCPLDPSNNQNVINGGSHNVAGVNANGVTSGIAVSDEDPACIKCSSNCDLVLEKTCEVPSPPAGPFVCSSAKPIDSITMIWNGSQTINIKAWKGTIGSTLLATINGITPGKEVTVSGYAGSPNDVIWEIFNATTGSKIGNSTFHLSCSDVDMNGPEDCGATEGDGKGLTGYINSWIFEGMAGNGQVLDCTPVPTGPTNECVTQLGPMPDCTTAGKPTSLTFRYTGGGCAESKNTQAPDKAVCTATPTGDIVDGLITVRAAGNSSLTSDVYGVSPTTVDEGFEFTITFGGSTFKADSYVEIKDNNGVKELNRIHTSCSQPLKVGDVFGSLELVAFNGQTAGNEVIYTYTLTNNGDALTNVTISDVPLGEIIDPPTTLASGETKTYKAIAELTGSVTNIATATGYLHDNQVCSAIASATVTVEVPQVPFVCSEAKPINSISMVWNGTQNIKIKAWKGAVGSTLLATIDNIKHGDEVTVTGYAGSPNDVYWEIFEAGTTNKIGTSTFHLSCSDADMNDPEDCGKLEGDGKGKTGFINDWLFAGMAGNGKTLDCGAVTPPPPPAINVVALGNVRLGDHWLWWDLTNSGPDTAVITKVEVTAWPSQQGKLKKIKLDGDVTADPADIATPPAIITAFTSDVNKKKIAAGQTRTFTIEFEKNYLLDVPNDYKFTITFEGGEISWNVP